MKGREGDTDAGSRDWKTAMPAKESGMMFEGFCPGNNAGVNEVARVDNDDEGEECMFLVLARESRTQPVC